jgi:hypothetical protein
MFHGTDSTDREGVRQTALSRAPVRLGVVLGAAAVAVLIAGTASAATGWATVPTVDPSATGNTLTAVSARTSTDAWAVGYFANPADDAGRDGLAEHWNGQQWQRVPVPSTLHFDEKLLAVGGSGANDVWAVGSTNQISFAGTSPLIEHWNGASWTRVPAPAATGGSKSNLDGVVAFSPTNAWAVGRSATARALVEHWDGTAWSIVPVPDPTPPVGGTLASAMLTGVSAVSPTDIWAVGSYSLGGIALTGLTLTMHYDGTAWTVVRSPNIPGGTTFNPERTVLNAVAAAGHSDVWAVGNIFTTDGTNAAAKAEVMHWDGVAWRFVADAATTNLLSAVTAASATDVWAVGVNGTEHWNGTAWTAVAIPSGLATSALLSGASAVPGTGEAWAVGNNVGRSLALHHTA